MIPTPELQTKIASWRARADGNGEPMTIKDWEEAFLILRSERSAALASAASKAKRSTVAKAPVDLASLKNSLKALKKL